MNYAPTAPRQSSGEFLWTASMRHECAGDGGVSVAGGASTAVSRSGPGWPGPAFARLPAAGGSGGCRKSGALGQWYSRTSGHSERPSPEFVPSRRGKVNRIRLRTLLLCAATDVPGSWCSRLRSGSWHWPADRLRCCRGWGPRRGPAISPTARLLVMMKLDARWRLRMRL